MAALLADFGQCAERGERQLFWNTYHRLGAPKTGQTIRGRSALPAEFQSYFD